MTKQGSDFLQPVSAMEQARFAGAPKAIALVSLLHSTVLRKRRNQPLRAEQRGGQWKDSVNYSNGPRIREQATQLAKTLSKCC